MAATSSTFSSEPLPAAAAVGPGESAPVVPAAATSAGDAPPARRGRPHGFPYGFAGAIALLVLLELALRTRDSEGLIAYRSEFSQYQAIPELIARRGPAEVALVGSSQMREGVSMPHLAAALEKCAGRPVSAGNYSARGARADVFEAVADELLAHPRPPRVVVVGVSVRDLRRGVIEPGKPGVDLPRLAVFYGPGEWVQEFRRTGWAATAALPQVVRNVVGRWCHTLRFREKIAAACNAAVLRGVGVTDHTYRDELNPIIGQHTVRHVEGVSRHTPGKWPYGQLKRAIGHGVQTYDWEGGAEPAPEMYERMEAALRKLSASGSTVILFEMPLHPLWHREVERAGFVGPFRAAVRRAIAGTNIAYWPLARQRVTMVDADFRDLQHHNRMGAEKFSRFLADVICSALTERAHGGRADQPRGSGPTTRRVTGGAAPDAAVP